MLKYAVFLGEEGERGLIGFLHEGRLPLGHLAAGPAELEPDLVLGKAAEGGVAALRRLVKGLKRKFMRCSQCQELGQLADLASDWLFTLEQPI